MHRNRGAPPNSPTLCARFMPRHAKAASAASSTSNCLGSTAHGSQRLGCVLAWPTLHIIAAKEGRICCLHVSALAPGMRTSILHLSPVLPVGKTLSPYLARTRPRACIACQAQSPPIRQCSDSRSQAFRLRSQSVARLCRHARNSGGPSMQGPPRGQYPPIVGGGSRHDEKEQKKMQRREHAGRKQGRCNATCLLGCTAQRSDKRPRCAQGCDSWARSLQGQALRQCMRQPPTQSRHRSERRKQRASTESGGQSRRGAGSAGAQCRARSALHPRLKERASRYFPHARGARLRSRQGDRSAAAPPTTKPRPTSHYGSSLMQQREPPNRIKQCALQCISPGSPSASWLQSSSAVRVHAMCRGCHSLMLAGGIGPKGHCAAQMRGPRRLIWRLGARLGAAIPYIWVPSRWASSQPS